MCAVPTHHMCVVPTQHVCCANTSHVCCANTTCMAPTHMYVAPTHNYKTKCKMALKNEDFRFEKKISNLKCRVFYARFNKFDHYFSKSLKSV